MVTTIYKGRPRRLYLVEWREHLDLSADQVADRMEVTRQTVHRWEREQHRMNPEKQAGYAHAIGIEPEDLWRHPGRPSVDGLLAQVPDEKVQGVAEMVTLWIKTGTGN